MPTSNHPPTPVDGSAARLRALLDGFRPNPASDIPEQIQKAVYVARTLQQRAAELQTPHEERQQAELERMVLSPHDKATLVQITDQALRCASAPRAADQLIILDVQGIPRFFTRLDQALLKGFQSFGGYLPGVAIPLIREKMHEETANVILPAEEEHLFAHLRWNGSMRPSTAGPRPPSTARPRPTQTTSACSTRDWVSVPRKSEHRYCDKQ